MLIEPRSAIYASRTVFSMTFVGVQITGLLSAYAYPASTPRKPIATHTNITTVALSNQETAVIRG